MRKSFQETYRRSLQQHHPISVIEDMLWNLVSDRLKVQCLRDCQPPLQPHA